MRANVLVRAALAGGALAVVCGSASAALIQQGVYRLHNHPDGNANPPPYGAKLNELYDATGNLDVFTFNFDDPQSEMYLEYTGTTIHIYGVALGGRDLGSSYANDQYLGLYTFDFTYMWGVGLAPGDDDLLVELPESRYNYGTVLTPLGDLVGLRDGHYNGDQPDFRFGDEDDDLGHRGFPGLSGWGWLFKALPGEPYTYTQDSDWIFTAEFIPTPGSLTLLLSAGVVMGRRRR